MMQQPGVSHVIRVEAVVNLEHFEMVFPFAGEIMYYVNPQTLNPRIMH
jgi:hypothetical protein